MSAPFVPIAPATPATASCCGLLVFFFIHVCLWSEILRVRTCLGAPSSLACLSKNSEGGKLSVDRANHHNTIDLLQYNSWFINTINGNTTGLSQYNWYVITTGLLQYNNRLIKIQLVYDNTITSLLKYNLFITIK